MAIETKPAVEKQEDNTKLVYEDNTFKVVDKTTNEEIVQKQTTEDSNATLLALKAKEALAQGAIENSKETLEQKETIADVKAFEKQAMEIASLYPDVEENCMSTSFSHIFQGGYSSGYYSYKWAEVLDADAFAYFQEKGIFNKEVATKFKDNVLSKGGTELPMELYKKFRGQEPKVEALLKRAGLI